MEGSSSQNVPWPLSFRLSAVKPDQDTSLAQNWSHELYRGPQGQKVQVLYSQNIQDSEQIAKKFLKEGILGFDMEWNWWLKKEAQARLQERIGLIQLACEDKIGLFHIGLHKGNDPDDLIAPSLRKIIEDSNITKTGVNIVRADFARLRDWFGLDPRGAFELSHLHNLVTHGQIDPSRCTTKLFSLDKHVEAHLDSRLPKGEERMSRWNRPLSPQQKSYAAADAYAGFMLYHRMNAKRLAMLPSPPLPIHADKYTKTERSTLIQLRTSNNNGNVMTAVDFFMSLVESNFSSSEEQDDDAQNGAIPMDALKTPDKKRRTSQSRTPRSTKQSPANEVKKPFDLIDTVFSTRLFEKLRVHRRLAARQRGYAPYIVAHDKQLHDISRMCPLTTDELLTIRGIGKSKVGEHGEAWLSLVTSAIEELQMVDLPGPPWKNVKPFDMSSKPTTSMLTGTDQPSSANQEEPSEGFLPPTLHTGLSFSLANAELNDVNLDVTTSSSDSQSDSSSAFETDARSRSPSSHKRKLESCLTNTASRT